MDFTQDHKEKIERSIVDIIANALDAGQITTEETSAVADFFWAELTKLPIAKN